MVKVQVKYTCYQLVKPFHHFRRLVKPFHFFKRLITPFLLEVNESQNNSEQVKGGQRHSWKVKETKFILVIYYQYI